ncbi:MAG: hypothetical protein HC872_01750 [Gammaproteobacteria bacterium]|nr:hypothetical protein [Gammaproteobacteria bacterium]
MVEAFLLGVIVTASLTAGALFLKFWRKTRDVLFLGFAAAFIIESVNRLAFLFLEQPNEGTPFVYIVRLFSYLLILAAIVQKNRG